MGKKIFLAQRTDGFGERLRAILNAMAFSDYYGLDFKFNYKEREGGLREFHSVGSLDSIFSKIFIDTYHKYPPFAQEHQHHFHINHPPRLQQKAHYQSRFYLVI
jgi:hypothetical protein